jgi:ribosomal protein S18 acetylase RimI-like enzyme
MDAAEPAPAREFTLRRAVAEDAPAIGAVFDAAVRDGWTFLGELAQRPMFSAQDWDQLVADHAPPNALLVAADAAYGIIGYTAVDTEKGEMFLLFVDPAHAGRGVGRALLNAAHDVLRAAGHTEVFLYTEERNTRARAVYAAAGYCPDGTARTSELHGVLLRELRLVKTFHGPRRSERGHLGRPGQAGS